MKLVIASKSEKPIYEQIFEQISSQILTGELSPDFCLPSIRGLSRELGTSVITIKGAYELLEQNGYIYTLAGKGCFVSNHPKHRLEDKKLTLASEQIKKDLCFYRDLGFSLEALFELIKAHY